LPFAQARPAKWHLIRQEWCTLNHLISAEADSVALHIIPMGSESIALASIYDLSQKYDEIRKMVLNTLIANA
jgi:uncharacterized membrane protein YccF (DUF307 family)